MNYLTSQMRRVLFVVSVISFVFVVFYIRKSRVKIEDTIFWVLASAMLLLFSVFPGIVYYIAAILSIESPANFVFALFIFLLLVNQFYTTMKLSHTQIRLNELAQRIALDSSKEFERKEKTEDIPED